MVKGARPTNPCRFTDLRRRELLLGLPTTVRLTVMHRESVSLMVSHARQAHKATLQRKVAERGAELAAKQQQRAAAEAERTALEVRVAAQTFSREDVQRMTADKCGLSSLSRLAVRLSFPALLSSLVTLCCQLAKGGFWAASC